MQWMRRFVIAAAAVAAAGGGAVGLTGSQAFADAPAGLAAGGAQGHQHHYILNAALAPSQPIPTDSRIFGVPPGGAPWSLSGGRVRLSSDGALEIDVHGLVLTTTGANPLPYLAATVYCNGMAPGVTTAPVPYSTRGDARIDVTVSLPAFCAVPAVLLNPASGSTSGSVLGIYIGFDQT